MCGAYGCKSETSVSAAKRASGATGSSASECCSSISADTGVWNWKRRPMSSLTRAIVSCALRVSFACRALGNINVSPAYLDLARAR